MSDDKRMHPILFLLADNNGLEKIKQVLKLRTVRLWIVGSLIWLATTCAIYWREIHRVFFGTAYEDCLSNGKSDYQCTNAGAYFEDSYQLREMLNERFWSGPALIIVIPSLLGLAVLIGSWWVRRGK